MTMERRALATPPELRAGDKGKKIAGYAAVFNQETDIGGSFREIIAPGAFKGSLDGDIRALVDHDTGRVIGRSKAGTLRLNEDNHGLAVEVDLPDTTDGRDLAVSLERGDISGMSFGFRVTHDEWDETGDIPTRTIRAVELFEVSAVAFPAYDGTELALRSLDKSREDQKEHNREGWMRRKAADLRARASEHRFRKIPGVQPEA
jgi:HK97 family phage prohead protease